MIVVVIVGLIALGLFFFGGAWGMVVLWLSGMLLLLPSAAYPVMLFLDARRKLCERRWAGAMGSLMGGLLAAAAWLAVEGYLACRAWRAIP